MAKIHAIACFSEHLVGRWRAMQAIQYGLYKDAVKDIEISFLTVPEYGENYNVTVAQNKTIDEAIRIKAEWMIHTSCDFIFVKPPTIFPTSGFAIIKGYMQKSSDDWPLEIKEEQYQGVSIYLVHRDLFKYRYHPDMKSRNYGDYDYLFNEIIGNNINPGITDARCMHIHHIIRPINSREAEKNKTLYETRAAALKKG